MKSAAAMLMPALVMLLASLLLPATAQARDRPGTPNGGFTGYCANALSEEPAMCVEFRNTATEKVGFLMEWTENGALMPSDLSGRSECRMHSAQEYDCRALHHWFSGHTDFEQADKLSELINPTTSGKFKSDRNVVQGFRLKGLLYDTEYCFHFMAVDLYGVRSGAWSGFTCARTPSPPGKPAAASTPKVTGIQPTSGEGVVGNGTPFQLLVEWTGPQVGAENVGWYSIELLRNSKWIAVPFKSEPNRVNSATNFEALVEAAYLDSPGQRQAARVCSQNVQQKTCSREGWYYTFGKAQATVTNETVRAAATPSRAIDVRSSVSVAQAAAVNSAVAANAAAGGAPKLPDLDVLAARGAELATQDPRAAELRNRVSEGDLRRGFDIGFGIWEGNAAPGPGKQRVHDALSRAEQPGFDVAAEYSFPRNKHAALADVGAAIGDADVEVGAARNAEDDVFFRLGFDIASGIFGDPAMGSLGNTATGPGSLGIRNELNAAGQRGFNAATALHLSRHY